MGFVLVSTEVICADTLLCEYAGVLVSRQNDNFEQVELDSNLYIESEEFANEARFISSTPANFNANCILQRVLCQGVPRVFVKTISEIRTGDIFYIDYGEAWRKDDFKYIKNVNIRMIFNERDNCAKLFEFIPQSDLNVQTSAEINCMFAALTRTQHRTFKNEKKFSYFVYEMLRLVV